MGLKQTRNNLDGFGGQYHNVSINTFSMVNIVFRLEYRLCRDSPASQEEKMPIQVRRKAQAYASHMKHLPQD